MPFSTIAGSISGNGCGDRGFRTRNTDGMWNGAEAPSRFRGRSRTRRLSCESRQEGNCVPQVNLRRESPGQQQLCILGVVLCAENPDFDVHSSRLMVVERSSYRQRFKPSSPLQHRVAPGNHAGGPPIDLRIRTSFPATAGLLRKFHHDIFYSSGSTNFRVFRHGEVSEIVDILERRRRR